jgi:hypothetical protein
MSQMHCIQPTMCKSFCFKIEINAKADSYMPCKAMTHSTKLGTAPLCKVVVHTLFGNHEGITDWKHHICKVIFTCQDMEVCDTSIIEHCWVCCWFISPTKYIIKLHIKPTNGQVILCDAHFTIISYLTHFCGCAAVYMCSIDGTEDIHEAGVKFWIGSSLVYLWG